MVHQQILEIMFKKIKRKDKKQNMKNVYHVSKKKKKVRNNSTPKKMGLLLKIQFTNLLDIHGAMMHG